MLVSRYEKLTAWFNELWDKSEEFSKELMEELDSSWALNEVRPYDVYINDPIYRNINTVLIDESHNRAIIGL